MTCNTSNMILFVVAKNAPKRQKRAKNSKKAPKSAQKNTKKSHCMDSTICTHWESQCLPYVGFFLTVTGFVLKLKRFLMNMTVLVLSFTQFLLHTTGSLFSITWFFKNGWFHVKQGEKRSMSKSKFIYELKWKNKR